MHCPGSSVVEHLHGKQEVVGSIPILGKKENLLRTQNTDKNPEEHRVWQKNPSKGQSRTLT